MLAKEVLAPVDLAGLGEGRIFGVERGHAEHLAGASQSLVVMMGVLT